MVSKLFRLALSGVLYRDAKRRWVVNPSRRHPVGKVYNHDEERVLTAHSEYRITSYPVKASSAKMLQDDGSFRTDKFEGIINKLNSAPNFQLFEVSWASYPIQNLSDN